MRSRSCALQWARASSIEEGPPTRWTALSTCLRLTGLAAAMSSMRLVVLIVVLIRLARKGGALTSIYLLLVGVVMANWPMILILKGSGWLVDRVPRVYRAVVLDGLVLCIAMARFSWVSVLVALTVSAAPFILFPRPMKVIAPAPVPTRATFPTWALGPLRLWAYGLMARCAHGPLERPASTGLDWPLALDRS